MHPKCSSTSKRTASAASGNSIENEDDANKKLIVFLEPKIDEREETFVSVMRAN